MRGIIYEHNVSIEFDDAVLNVRNSGDELLFVLALKTFLHANVYHSPALLEERRQSVAMIGTLFGHYMKDPDRLPEPYCEMARKEPAHRVVCDYIAGMTDGFCRRAFQALP